MEKGGEARNRTPLRTLPVQDRELGPRVGAHKPAELSGKARSDSNSNWTLGGRWTSAGGSACGGTKAVD